MSRVAIGLDIGGTKVAAALVTEAGDVLASVSKPTPAQSLGADAVVDVLSEAAAELVGLSTHEPVGVGIGSAGLVSAGRVHYCAHLPLRGEPLAELVSSRVGLPVELDNDANVAALAEARIGAAAGTSVALVVNLGTGIGGALVVDGRVMRGAHGFAGEFGHSTISRGGRRCACGRSGCWEQYASGRALEREVPGRDGVDITAAALNGHQESMDAFAAVGGWLGLGLANLVADLDPEVVVVGGGLSATGELLLGPARVAMREALFARDWRPQVDVVGAALGSDAGVIGGALLVLDRLSAAG